MSKVEKETENLYSLDHTHELIFVDEETGEILRNFLTSGNTGSRLKCITSRMNIKKLYPEYTIYIGVLKKQAI